MVRTLALIMQGTSCHKALPRQILESSTNQPRRPNALDAKRAHLQHVRT